MPMKRSKINKLRKKEKIENPKEWWQIPLWKLKYKGMGLLTNDMVEKTKLIDNHSYMQVRKEKFLQGLSKR